MASVDDLYASLVAEAGRLGVSPEPTWKRDLAMTYQGDPGTGIGARTSEDIYASILSQQAGRATSTNDRIVDSQSELGRQLYQSDSNAREAAKAPPPAVASQITTLGASEPAGATPTVGPVGLAYPDDPVRYSTNQQGAQYGYSGAGTLPSGIYQSAPALALAPAAAAPLAGAATSPLVMWVLLGGAALAAFLILRK